MDSQAPSYCFLMPVWGRRFVDIFLDFALPSHLAEGNLSALKNRNNYYIIYTFAKDVEHIKQHQLYIQLEQFCTVLFEIVDEDIQDHRLRAADCYQHGVEFALLHNCRVFLTIPDGIFSINSFAFVDKILNSGYKGIMAPCHSVEIEAARKILQQYRDTQQVLQLNGRQCVDIVLQAMHSNTKNKFYHGSGNLMPASLCWQVADQGILSHSFHLPPIAVILKPDAGKFAGAIDLDFMIQHCPEKNDIYYVQDSDDLALFEVVDSHHVIEAIHQKANPDHIVDWAIVHANPQHRVSFDVPLLQKSSKYVENHPLWQQALLDAGRIVEYVDEQLASNFSITKILKFRYAYLRRFLLQIHDAQRMQHDTTFNVISKVLVRLHRRYTKCAAKYLIWQNKAFNIFWGISDNRKNCFWNINHWKSQLLDLPTQHSKSVEVSTGDIEYKNILRLLLGIDSQQEIARVCISASALKYLSAEVPKLIQLRSLHSEPVLVQMLKFPLRWPYIGLRVIYFNFMLGNVLKV